MLDASGEGEVGTADVMWCASVDPGQEIGLARFRKAVNCGLEPVGAQRYARVMERTAAAERQQPTQRVDRAELALRVAVEVERRPTDQPTPRLCVEDRRGQRRLLCRVIEGPPQVGPRPSWA